MLHARLQGLRRSFGRKSTGLRSRVKRGCDILDTPELQLLQESRSLFRRGITGGSSPSRERTRASRLRTRSRGLYLLRDQGRSSQWLPRQLSILRAAQEPFPPRPRLRRTQILSGGTGHRRYTLAVPGSPGRPELSHALSTCLIGGAITPPSSGLNKSLATSPPTSVTGGEASLSARPSTEMGGAQLVSYPRTQAADFSESALPGKGNETIA